MPEEREIQPGAAWPVTEQDLSRLSRMQDMVAEQLTPFHQLQSTSRYFSRFYDEYLGRNAVSREGWTEILHGDTHVYPTAHNIILKFGKLEHKDIVRSLDKTIIYTFFTGNDFGRHTVDCIFNRTHHRVAIVGEQPHIVYELDFNATFGRRETVKALDSGIKTIMLRSGKGE